MDTEMCCPDPQTGILSGQLSAVSPFQDILNCRCCLCLDCALPGAACTLCPLQMGIGKPAAKGGRKAWPFWPSLGWFCWAISVQTPPGGGWGCCWAHVAARLLPLPSPDSFPRKTLHSKPIWECVESPCDLSPGMLHFPSDAEHTPHGQPDCISDGVDSSSTKCWNLPLGTVC